MTEVSFRVSFSLFTLRRVVLCWFRSRGCGGGRVRGGLRREFSPLPQENRLLLRSLGVRGSFRFLEAKRRFAFWACCSSWKAVLESSPEYVMVLAHAAPRSRPHGLRFCFFRTVNQTAVLGPVSRLQRPCPAGAKRSLPDRARDVG